MKEIKPNSAREYILFAVVNVLLSYQNGNVMKISYYFEVSDTSFKTIISNALKWILRIFKQKNLHVLQREYASTAQNYFNRVGSSESEHDSLFGRVCMASAHFLSGNFDHCALYLNSVRTHYFNDDTFNYNFAQVHRQLYCIEIHDQVISLSLASWFGLFIGFLLRLG